MNSTDLDKLLSPFKLVVSRNALAPHFKAIELAPDHITACAPYALLQRKADLGIRDVMYVDAAAFLAVAQSLPPSEPVTLSSESGNLSWACGAARGRLARMSVSDMPAVPEPTRALRHATNRQLATALELGAISCGDNAVPGTYGVVIDNTALVVCSTDNSTISSYRIDEALKGAPDIVTLPPPGVEVLAAVLDNGGELQFNSNGVVSYRDKNSICVLRQIAPLVHSIRGMLDTLGGGDVTIPLPLDRVNAFVKRATALAENRRDAKVLLSLDQGRIILSFAEGAVMSDEYFLADELTDPGFAELKPVSLSVIKFSRALSHSTEIVLDFIERGVLSLRHDRFNYLVSGKVLD